MSDLPKQLEDCEKILSDRFTDYLIVAVDGDFIYNKASSNIASLGMCKYIEAKVYNCWNTPSREDV